MENINLLGKELGLKESFLGRKMMDTEARKMDMIIILVQMIFHYFSNLFIKKN